MRRASEAGWPARNSSGCGCPGPNPAPALEDDPVEVDDQRLGDGHVGPGHHRGEPRRWARAAASPRFGRGRTISPAACAIPRLVAADVRRRAVIETKRAPEMTAAMEAAARGARGSRMPTTTSSTPSRGIALSHSTVRRGRRSACSTMLTSRASRGRCGSRVPVDQLALEDDAVPVVAEAGRGRLRTAHERHVTGAGAWSRVSRSSRSRSRPRRASRRTRRPPRSRRGASRPVARSTPRPLSSSTRSRATDAAAGQDEGSAGRVRLGRGVGRACPGSTPGRGAGRRRARRCRARGPR